MNGLGRGMAWTMGGALVLALAISCSTISRTVVVPHEIPGAHYVGNRACYECHTNYVRVFPSSPHARIHLTDAVMADQGGCESCHGPGSKHIEAGGGRAKFIFNPGKNPDSCFQCHLDTEAQFHLPQHHGVIEGRMNCVQCHDPHGMDIFKLAGGLKQSRRNETCAECHREQTRPMVFEHEALREGCTVCHSPHGSINDKLLVERDNNLCLKCHAQRQTIPGQIFIGLTLHTSYLKMGTCWTAGCHTAVHGSNFSPKQLY